MKIELGNKKNGMQTALIRKQGTKKLVSEISGSARSYLGTET